MVKKPARKKTATKTTTKIKARAKLKIRAKTKAKSVVSRIRKARPRLHSYEPGTRHPLRRHPRAVRRIAYYRMGVAALGISVLVSIYQIYQSARPRAKVNGNQASAILQAAPAVPERFAEPPTVTPFVHSQNLGMDALGYEFQEVQNLSIQDKIDYWSNYLESNMTGRQKVASLSSGIKIDDTAPLIPSKYNCTTFVETVVALARSEVPQELVKNLISIRYVGGQPGFMRRNHFPEADWIPNNEKAEILTDITHRVALKTGVLAKAEKKMIDRGKWLQTKVQQNSGYRKLASLNTPDAREWTKPIEVQVPYITMADIQKAIPNIPNGSVLNLVHQNDHRHPVLIAHQGFVIRDGDRILLRHASAKGKIRTSDLLSYLNSLASRDGVQKLWPLIGVNLNQINDSTSKSSFFRQAM